MLLEHEKQFSVVSTVPRPQSNTGPLGFGGMADLHNLCTTDKICTSKRRSNQICKKVTSEYICWLCKNQKQTNKTFSKTHSQKKFYISQSPMLSSFWVRNETWNQTLMICLIAEWFSSELWSGQCYRLWWKCQCQPPKSLHNCSGVSFIR